MAGALPPIDNRLFWIGQNSHWTRPLLVDMSRKYPDKIHAKILNWRNRVIPQTEMVSLEDHTKYKYLIDLSGQGFSARIKYLMFSRRPLFIVDREFHDWISVDLVPWVHFIPVMESKMETDLLEKLEWAENNSSKANEIAENALDFISQKLTPECIISKIDATLSHITSFKKITG